MNMYKSPSPSEGFFNFRSGESDPFPGATTTGLLKSQASKRILKHVTSLIEERGNKASQFQILFLVKRTERDYRKFHLLL